MADLESQFLSFSLLKEGEDEDVRNEQRYAEYQAKQEAQRDYDEDMDPAARERIERHEIQAALKAAETADDPFATRRRGPTAGPKAVLADKAWHDFLQMKAGERQQLQEMDYLRKLGYGAKATGPSMSLAAQVKVAQRDMREEDKEVVIVDGERVDPRRGGAARGAALDSDARMSSSRAGDPEFFRSLAGSGLEASASDRRGELRDSYSASAAAAAGVASAPSSSSSSSSREAPTEDQFMAAYRARRKAEYLAMSQLPVFGELLELRTQAEYLSAVDGLDSRCLAVVLLWEPYIPAADAAHRAMEELAALHPHTAFMSLRSTVASASFDPIGLPALAVYKGGKTVDSVVRLQDEAGVGDKGDFPVADMERVLLQRGILLNPVAVLDKLPFRRGPAGAAAAGAGGSGGGSASNIVQSAGFDDVD